MNQAAPEIVARRAVVARLADDGASLRQIAAQLGISKDTARRDLAAHRDAITDQVTGVEKRASEAEAAMRQLATAVSSVVSARPGYVIVPDAVAHQWRTTLEEHVLALRQLADSFNDYYPS
ncbi:helix-turn-helix domain-containing protein [Streptomyces sp. NPDC048696]|uniref:helix-turn-helix domain-containing protein n=1 Tax=Streptomyces sp. NPDC048696 TaxID=3365585 RepID=UPI0037225FD9